MKSDASPGINAAEIASASTPEDGCGSGGQPTGTACDGAQWVSQQASAVRGSP